MIADWIDDLCAVWTISSPPFGLVKSYTLVKDADFPESIDLNQLAQHPIAMTFWPKLQPEYSAGGPLIAHWRGVTEIHLVPDFSKARIRELMPWYKLVLDAAAGHAKLNGKVELFMIAEQEDAIDLTSLQYGEEAVHWGIVIQWTVKESLNGKLVVSA